MKFSDLFRVCFIADLLVFAFGEFNSLEKARDEECEIEESSNYEVSSRNFVTGRWPNATVYYNISYDFTEKEMKLIFSAMVVVEIFTCVRWVQRIQQEPYVQFEYSFTTCSASIGYDATRKVGYVKLTYSCLRSQGKILHELLHVLGFRHEHTRPDRDEFITVKWKKIKKGHYHNFFKSSYAHQMPPPILCNESDPTMDFDKCWSKYPTDTLGLPYDYNSIMHYGLFTFSKNGEFTMIPKKPVPLRIKIGQRDGLSSLDIKKINKAYNCCLNDGAYCFLNKGLCYLESVAQLCKYSCNRC